MAERIMIPFTNEHFAAWCLSMLGQPYWYGTVVYKCTEELRKRKATQYPGHYGSNRTARYRDDIAKKKVCADCIGGAKGYAWTGGGIGVVDAIGTDKPFINKYGANSCPDRSANGMFLYAKSAGMEWGTINTLPEIVGIALHRDGHVGYYVGDGYAVEWRGYRYGCVKTRVANRDWKYWYKLPFIDYNDAAGTVAPTVEYVLGSRLLKKGMKGPDVKALQELLMQLGYKLPNHGADSDFGYETESAVKAFQKIEGLEVDGKYGSLTHAALMAAVADDDEGRKDDAGDTEPEAEPANRKLVIVSEGGKVNVRVGNGTGYVRITSVAPGTTFNLVATASNGWHAIEVAGQVGWVSGNFSKVVA